MRRDVTVLLRVLFTSWATVLVALSPLATQAQQPTFANTLQPFLNRYCSDCHGPQQQKGDRRFDTLTVQINDDDNLIDYQDILDQLNLGYMPPTEAQQPSVADRRQAVEFLTAAIARFHQTRKDHNGKAVLRRLNAREYRNTIRDLLQINVTIFDPTESFPRDDTTDHLDNVGESLVTSSHLLAAYLDAADQVIDKAIYPLQQPAVQTWTFRDGFRQQPEIDQVHRKTNQFKHMTLYDVIGADKHEGAYGPIHAFAAGVPHDGYYEIRLRAEAVNRLHPYDDDFLGRDRQEPLRLGIRPGHREVGSLHLPQPNEPLLAELDLADEPQWYTVRVWLDKGYTPRFTFRNGLMDARNLWSRLIRKYPDQFAKGLSGIVALRFNAIKHGKLPQIHIHEIEIKGPLYESWPRPSQRAVLKEHWESALAGELNQQQLRDAVRTFAERAYRRSVTEADIDTVMRIIAARQESGLAPIEAFADGLKTILCSPHFLYLAETDQKQLSSTALASRLAYFLWATMPDDRLMELAATGELQTTEVLQAEVRRMLADPRSNAFVQGFLDSWLTLRELGSAPPDRNAFAAFYQHDLGTAMRQETHLFMRYLIDENLDLGNIIDSDFTFVNKPLARLYGIDPPPQSGFQRVTLNDRRRGGLLGQASVLTVTANGIDTSPVVRGVWMLENLLGTPPSPPPPDVEPLDPDIRGAKTIRDQLRKHRDSPTCNDCHRKIDPLGFALENFDPIGRWRNEYGRKIQVDASGELPDGQQFADIRELKQLLAGRRQQVSQALAEKMLAYATGRQMVPSDRPHIDKILTTLEAGGGGMRDLIEQIVLSEPFRSK